MMGALSAAVLGLATAGTVFVPAEWQDQAGERRATIPAVELYTHRLSMVRGRAPAASVARQLVLPLAA